MLFLFEEVHFLDIWLSFQSAGVLMHFFLVGSRPSVAQTAKTRNDETWVDYLVNWFPELFVCFAP